MPKLLTKGFQALALPFVWILIQRAKHGDKQAFGTLYQMYLDRIYRYIFFKTRQNRTLAEDLTSEVFVKAWQKIDTFGKSLPAGRQGSFQAWLYTIARNTLIDHIRSIHTHVVLNENIPDEKETIEESVDQKMTIEKVMQCLDSLTTEQREIIILRFVNDLSYKEIVHIIGKKEEAIRAMQYRALKILRKSMANI